MFTRVKDLPRGRDLRKCPPSVIAIWLREKGIPDPTGEVAKNIAARIDKESFQIK